MSLRHLALPYGTRQCILLCQQTGRLARQAYQVIVDGSTIVDLSEGDGETVDVLLLKLLGHAGFEGRQPPTVGGYLITRHSTDLPCPWLDTGSTTEKRGGQRPSRGKPRPPSAHPTLAQDCNGGKMVKPTTTTEPSHHRHAVHDDEASPTREVGLKPIMPGALHWDRPLTGPLP